LSSLIIKSENRTQLKVSATRSALGQVIKLQAIRVKRPHSSRLEMCWSSSWNCRDGRRHVLCVLHLFIALNLAVTWRVQKRKPRSETGL